MTERDVTTALIRDLVKRSLVVPNFTPPKWWEVDLTQITGAGYFVEYEVKLSVADFRANAQKSRSLHRDSRDAYAAQMQLQDQARRAGLPIPPWPEETKHSCLARGDQHGPSRFYYVAPAGMITLAMLPVWAGLMEIQPCEEGVERRPFLALREKLKAPRIHGEKATDDMRRRFHSSVHYRMHLLMRGLKPEDPA